MPQAILPQWAERQATPHPWGAVDILPLLLGSQDSLQLEATPLPLGVLGPLWVDPLWVDPPREATPQQQGATLLHQLDQDLQVLPQKRHFQD